MATTEQTTTTDIVGGARGRAGSAVGRARLPGGIGALIAALLAGLLIGGAVVAFITKPDAGFGGGIDKTRYQAVILTNDKVYFGQLESVSDEFFQLHSAFFLRETRDTADANPVRALLPVNREIHEPDNTMFIRKAQVVLVENLAKDSPILSEIKRQKG
jgi:hypothetical protein